MGVLRVLGRRPVAWRLQRRAAGRAVVSFIAAWIVSIGGVDDRFAAGQERATSGHAQSELWPGAYDGPSAGGVDNATLIGKVVCGYQGWFTTPTDGSGRGWRHYSKNGRFEPGRCNIDLWPDVSELDADELQPTSFRHADGSSAQVFSSHNRKTVVRHFEWMREHGIDGAMVQRFAVETVPQLDVKHVNQVLASCREGANRSGRVYAVMYDLSGLGAGGVQRVKEDWSRLVERMRIGRDSNDKAYLRHRGKPLVAVWGVGFNDGRKYTLDECTDLIDFLQNDSQHGGCAVMLGVPTGWRTLDADAVRDEKLLRIIERVEIVSPWAVGRFRDDAGIRRHVETRLKPDMAWCAERKVDFLPVVFPGFSWHNMRPQSTFDEIPRRGGQFLWNQYLATNQSGAKMVYQAMFDELDEATAIFKCSNEPPVGESRFVTSPGLPTDHYLWLTGQGGRLIRGEIPPTAALPVRNPKQPAPTEAPAPPK